MNYAESRQDIMMPLVSIVVVQSFYIAPAAIFALTLFKPCVQILGSSIILPCSGSSAAQNGFYELIANWNWEQSWNLQLGFQFWFNKGLNFILALLEHLLMQELVSVATLANYTANFYGLIVLTREYREWLHRFWQTIHTERSVRV